VADGWPAVWARPEDELLVCSARANLGSERAGRMEALLGEALDWDYLIRTATRHAMKPLLYWTLDRTCPEAVPQAQLDQLRDFFQSNSYQNLLQTRALLEALQQLDTQGITAVPYKGPVLAQRAYGNLSLRHFRDLDILVRKQDVLAASDVLVSLGYRPKLELPKNPDAPGWRSGQFDFVREVLVELHWDIAPTSFSFPLDPEHLWAHLQPASLGGSELQTLSPEDLLLLLCVHGAKHRWERLAWICDVANLVQVQKEMDWEKTMGQARVFGLERMLLLGLVLAGDLLGAQLPDEVRHEIEARPDLRHIAAQIGHWLFLEGGPSEFAKAFFHLRAVDRWGDRLRYGLGRITATSRADREAVSVPRRLSFLYYLFRPIRLLRTYRRARPRVGNHEQEEQAPTNGSRS
jgi:hypothetical protein